MKSDWQQDWLTLQTQFVDALTAAGKSAANSNFEIPGASSDWGFDAGTSSDRSWETLSRQFSELFTVLSDKGREGFDWESALRAYVQSAKARIKEDMGQEALADLQTEIQASFEKFFASVSRSADTSIDERLQENYRYWQLYQQNCQRYRNYMKNVDLASLDIVQEKLCRLADKNEYISSLREFYDLWVDCYEEAYETIILSKEYSELYGELINSLLEFRARSQDVSG